MIEHRGTIRNLAKWFRLCERLVDRSPRMERNTDTGAMVAGGPTSTGVLTRGQMARALREGSLGETRSGGTGGGVMVTAISRVGVRKYINNKGLRTSCGCVTLAMLMAAAITVAPTEGIPRNSLNPTSSASKVDGSISGSTGPSQSFIRDTNQEQQKKMIRNLTKVTAAIVVGASVTVAGAQTQVFSAPRAGAGVSIPHSDVQNAPIATGQMTIEFWVRCTSAGGASANGGRVLSKRGCSFEGYTVSLRPIPAGATIVIGFGTGQTYFDWHLGNIPANEWHHVALVWNRGLGSLRLVIDGATVNSTTVTNSQVPGIASNPLQFGEQCGWGFEGAMDNIRIWSIARSDADIAVDRFRQFALSEAVERPSLVGSWSFEHGPEVVDARGLNENGSFFGGGEIAEENLPGMPAPCIGDIYLDGFVNGADLGALLAYWGPTTNAAASIACDLNVDGVVNGSDLGILLGYWGLCSN